jgi:triphosphoribosyl-dephospho-CoA synthase
MTKQALAFGPVDADPLQLGRLAIASLHAELVCAPKPGLVTPFDSGSHDDMDAATFMRSLFSLRGYFAAIAHAGAAQAAFGPLQQLGIAAERAMTRATGGINTHRGAIFSLGLLVAAAASLRAQRLPTAAEAVCREVASRWGAPILATRADGASHGQRVARRYGAEGARGQAARGFPLLREVAIPTLRQALGETPDRNAAMVQTLMSLVATTEDTNVLHRGGAPGLAFAQRRSREFLDEGGIHARGWQARLASIGRDFESLRLSPGGSADLLACACFLVRLERAAT